MANLSVTWVPGAGSISQTILGRRKGTAGWVITPFTPTNPLGPLVGSSVFTGAYINAVYAFKVSSSCANGNTVESTPDEGIYFDCTAIKVVSVEGNGSFTVRTNLGLYHSITKVVFALYSAAGAFLEFSPEVVPNPLSGVALYTFSRPTGVDYKISMILKTTMSVAGVPTEVTSDLLPTCMTDISTVIPGSTVYAKLEYYDTGVEDCLGFGETVTLHKNKARFNVYSDIACTIPTPAPSGAEVYFDIRHIFTSCRMALKKCIYYDEESSGIVLGLTAGLTTTPVSDSLKKPLLPDWVNCSKSTSFSEICTGTESPDVCASDGAEKIQDIINITSTPNVIIVY